MTALDHVRSYYEALNSGDADRVAAHFTEDAVHYYTRLGPHEGGPKIAEYAAWAVANIDAQWHLEHGIESAEPGDGTAEPEVAIEWSMTWRDPRSGARRLDRGTEWFRFRDGLICEVRAYHHGGKKNPQGDLLGFDHAGRGHTMLEDWRAPAKVPQDP
ncbi:MAG: nuclear transport factor 2 family protein [Solirubrobacterales bacterium]